MSKWKIIACIWLIVMTAQGVSASDVGRQFVPEQFNSVLVGEDSTYVLRVDARRPLSLGLATIFISPTSGKLTLHSGLVLADSLAQKGWHVDLVTPHWLSLLPPVSDSPTDAQSSPDPSAILAWQSHLTAPLNFERMKQKTTMLLPVLDTLSEDVNGFKLHIAEGVIAALLLASGNEDGAVLADAATFISPFWPDREVNQTLPQLTANYPSPLLDISYVSSSRFARNQRDKRATLANVEVKLFYRNRTLPRTQNRHAMAWVSGEIVGWTRSLGW